MRAPSLLSSLTAAALAVLLACVAASCGTVNEEDGIRLTFTQRAYALYAPESQQPLGGVRFQRRTDGSVQIAISGLGASMAPGDSLRATLRLGPASEPGAELLTLATVRAATGASVTNVAELPGGGAASYEYFDTLNAHVALERFAGGALVATGDVGRNELTGLLVVRPLAAAGGSGLNGTVAVAQRRDGSALVTIQAGGAAAGTTYVATLRQGSGGGALGAVVQALGTPAVLAPGTVRSQTTLRAVATSTASSAYAALTGGNYYVTLAATGAPNTVLATGEVGQ